MDASMRGRLINKLADAMERDLQYLAVNIFYSWIFIKISVLTSNYNKCLVCGLKYKLNLKNMFSVLNF